MYAQLPFIGSSITAMRKKLLESLGKLYPQINPNFYFRESFTIVFLKHYPTDMLRSSVIYKYTCDCCQQFYIGSTALQLFRRCALHRGVSFRTGDRLSRPDNSAIRDHCFKNDHPFKISNFNVIDSTSQLLKIKTIPSIAVELNYCCR